MIATVLAGRDEDLGVIQQAFLGEASAGGAALLLTGEVGVGKTALLDAGDSRAGRLTQPPSKEMDNDPGRTRCRH